MKAHLQSVHYPSEGVVELILSPADALDYVAGQFVEVTVDHDNPDNRGIRRWFTLSSAPHESTISITTRLTEQPSSFKTALLNLHAGQSIEISQAMGDFVLPRQRATPILFIAAGIGITPVRSIIKSHLHEQSNRTINVIYIERSQKPAYLQELQQSATNVQATHIQPNELTAYMEQISASSTQDPTLQIYISGPEKFVESLQLSLKDTIKPHRIVTDFFHGYED